MVGFCFNAPCKLAIKYIHGLIISQRSDNGHDCQRTPAQICETKQANSRHIATHGLTHEAYLKEYEPSLYWQRKTIEKFNEMYVTVRYRFVEYGLNYTATIKKENRKYGLTDKDLKQHLEGKNTVALYTPEEKTKFLSFDIDIPDTGILETLVETLAAYIPREHINCSFSGRKGYHVDLFFSSLVDKRVTEKFYKLILSESGFSPKVVEGRGTTVHQALKLFVFFLTKLVPAGNKLS